MPILLTESYATFHSLCAFLIWSHIFNLEHITLIFGCRCFLYQMPSRAFVLIHFSSELFSPQDSSSEAEIDLSYTKIFSFFNKRLYSNCAKGILSQFSSWDDASYGIYKTASSVASDYEYGQDVYANALGNLLSNTISCE